MCRVGGPRKQKTVQPLACQEPDPPGLKLHDQKVARPSDPIHQNPSPNTSIIRTFCGKEQPGHSLHGKLPLLLQLFAKEVCGRVQQQRQRHQLLGG